MCIRDRIETVVRQQERDAVSEMQKYGLNVVEAGDHLAAAWKRQVAELYPSLRDRFAPGELIDEALRWRDEYRAR